MLQNISACLLVPTAGFGTHCRVQLVSDYGHGFAQAEVTSAAGILSPNIKGAENLKVWTSHAQEMRCAEDDTNPEVCSQATSVLETIPGERNGLHNAQLTHLLTSGTLHLTWPWLSAQ